MSSPRFVGVMSETSIYIGILVFTIQSRNKDTSGTHPIYRTHEDKQRE